MNNLNWRLFAAESLKDIIKKKSNFYFVFRSDQFNKFSLQDKNLIQYVLKGCTNNLRLLEYILEKVQGKDIKDIKLKSIYFIGIYEILFLDSIPSYAAVNEAVKITKKKFGVKKANFVNFILRDAERKRKDIFKQIDNIKDYSVKYSIDSSVINRWKKQYGKKFVQEYLEYLQKENYKKHIVINLKKVSKSEFVKLLRKLNVDYSESFLEPVLCIENNFSVLLNSGLYVEGYFWEQSLGSALIGEAVCGLEGKTVLDAASMPGGKSMYVTLMCPVKQLICNDINKKKLKMFKSNFMKYFGKIPESKISDIMDLDETKKFDIVLLDSPCSASGTLWKHPELKLKLNEEYIENSVCLEKKLLKKAGRLVNRGGYLIYATCSVDKIENSVNAEEFVSESGEFEFHDLSIDIPEEIRISEGQFQFFPFRDETDGIYFSVLHKK